MKKKILIILFVIVITLLVIIFPSLYFSYYDKKETKTFNINTIFKNNIYENANLSNNERFLILKDSSRKEVILDEEITSDRYYELNKIIFDEICKINSSLCEMYKASYNNNYEEVISIYIKDYYMISSEYDSLVLKEIYYETDTFGISALIDSYDNRLLQLSLFDIAEIDNSIKNINIDTLRDDFRKYLDIDSSLYNIDLEIGLNFLRLSIDMSYTYSEKDIYID